jgi:copper resistance protein B
MRCADTSTAEAGSRLRYEFNCQLAPYIGVAHERAFDNTAALRGDEQEAVEDTHLVASIRVF